MRKLLSCFLIVALAAGSAAYGQISHESKSREKTRKGYLAILFGPSLATGEFASDDWDSDRSGFAENGYQYSLLEFGIKFVPNFGMAAAIKGAVIPLNVQALADGYAQEYGGQFRVESTRWGYTGFFVGPFASIPTKHVDIDFRFMTGLLVAESPEARISRGSEVARQESAFGSSFGFNAGVGARVHVLKRVSLVAQADYHVSRPTFQITYYDTNNASETVSAGQLITLVNFSLGVAFRIF